jgi:hypothetical protein
VGYREENKACLTLEDLYSTWQDGEYKMQKIISFLRSEQASSKECDGMAEATSDVQFGMERDVDWNECSDDEPGTGGDVESEPVKEEATVVCSTSENKAPKQKNKKKPKKFKRKKGR